MTAFEALVHPGLPPHLGDPDRRADLWMTIRALNVADAQDILAAQLAGNGIPSYSYSIYHPAGDGPIIFDRLVIGWGPDEEEDADA